MLSGLGWALSVHVRVCFSLLIGVVGRKGGRRRERKGEGGWSLEEGDV